MAKGKAREHAYAIVRVDEFQQEDVAIENRVTVKRVVWDEATARDEVARLNELNAARHCRYFWQVTRVDIAE